MILILLCLCVPAALFMWKLCAIGADADEQMTVAFQEMMREKEENPQAAGADAAIKEDAHAG